MPQKNGFFAEDDSSTGLTSGIYWQTAGDLMGGGGVLVSHCREDAPGHTSRLVDRLRAQFKDRGVLFDFLEGRTGADLSGAVQGVVASCDAVLAVIGSSWLACVSGRRIRPSDAIPDTFCLEIAAALSRNVPVIPVLVQGAAMPRPETLPEGIRDLSRRQAFELRDRNWDRDVGELTAVLNQILTEKGGQAATVGMRGRRNFLAIAGALFAISVAAYWARSSSGR